MLIYHHLYIALTSTILALWLKNIAVKQQKWRRKNHHYILCFHFSTPAVFISTEPRRRIAQEQIIKNKEIQKYALQPSPLRLDAAWLPLGLKSSALVLSVSVLEHWKVLLFNIRVINRFGVLVCKPNISQPETRKKKWYIISRGLCCIRWPFSVRLVFKPTTVLWCILMFNILLFY